MTFVKGKSGNPKGKPKGALGIKTKQWEEFGRQLLEENTETAAKIINDSAKQSPERFMAYYFQLIEYFKPRQSRVESKTEIEMKETIIKVLYENINGK